MRVALALATAAGLSLASVCLLHVYGPGAGGMCPFGASTASALETQHSFTRGLAGLQVRSENGVQAVQAVQTAAPGGATATIFGVSRNSVTADSLAALVSACDWEVPGAFARCGTLTDSTVARFDPDGRLAGWDAERRFDSLAVALADFEREMLTLRNALGEPHQRGGDATAAELLLPARQASLRYRYRDVAVDLTITNLVTAWVVRRQMRELRGLL